MDTKHSAKYTLKAGSHIEKVFRGKKYVVEASAEGKFIYDGQEYKTLSGVAFVIYGKKVSGNDFFGLTKNSGDHPNEKS